MMRLIRSIGGWALATYALILHRTVRLTVRGGEHIQEMLQSGQPTIMASWHGQQHLLFPFLRRYMILGRMSAMIPNDERRQVLGPGLRLLGVRPYAISGDDESVGGPSRMLGLIRELRGGRLGFVNPDGPDGPARVPKEGLVFLAMLSGARILPLGAYTTSGYHIDRWDQYSLPLPFCRIAVVVRPPFRVPKEKDRSKGLEHVTRELTLAADQAEALYRGRPIPEA